MPGIDLTLSVSKLNEYVNSLLSNDLRLRSVKVKGEISALKLQQGSGHLYFTLKDETAVIRCIMFASKVASLRFEPADGSKQVKVSSIGSSSKQVIDLELWVCLTEKDRFLHCLNA